MDHQSNSEIDDSITLVAGTSRLIAYGVMMAPKSAIALAAAPFPWSLGTNMPLTTSPADGLR